MIESQDDLVLVVSYEGMHLVNLKEPVTVQTDREVVEYDCYDPDKGYAEYQGRKWNIIGLHSGSAILRSHQAEELKLDTKGLRISVW